MSNNKANVERTISYLGAKIIIVPGPATSASTPLIFRKITHWVRIENAGIGWSGNQPIGKLAGFLRFARNRIRHASKDSKHGWDTSSREAVAARAALPCPLAPYETDLSAIAASRRAA